MTTTAVIPVKQLANAKQRLSGLLSAEDMGLLVGAMVRDVLTAVEACSLIDQVVVVTDDLAVSELAREFDVTTRSPNTWISSSTVFSQLYLGNSMFIGFPV